MGLLSLQQQQPSPQSHQQGLPHPHYQHSRPPSSAIHQQHYHPQPNSGIHQQPSYATTSQSHQSQSPATSHPDGISYYSTYSTHTSPGAYPSTDSSDMMAAAQVQRHYPSIYHPTQSNPPASVASPSQHHDQNRGLYGQPPAQQMHHQSMYYQTQQYPPLSATASSYAQHPQHAQHTQAHQSMSPQPNLIMSHGQQSHVAGSHMAQGQMPQQSQMTQSPLAHSNPQMGTTPQMPQHQHQQQHAVQEQQSQNVTDSPRHPVALKMEGQMPLQIQKPSPVQPHSGANTTPLSPPSAGNLAQINPSAAPGPIPATTPLVVREDNNGVQWIAFEYSRDRVKMEYTIRCDVESVDQDRLSLEFRQENCVYPRACVAKEEYRGNRLGYETECNTVGWALAELNPPLQGKRGLIQRAVDSWRNSNQNPKLRSRRVRRMAKMSQRKPNSPLVGPNGAAPGMPAAPNVMGPSPGAMPKTGLGVMGQPMHHQQDGSGQVDALDSDDYGHHHHHQPPATGSGGGADVRESHGFSNSYHPGPNGTHYPNVNTGSQAPRTTQRRPVEDTPTDLFPDIPAAKKRKFILVEDNVRGSRLRVRVTLESVNAREIPDSFRKGSSVFPRSFFPREMQSPPPSPTGSRFFAELDRPDDDNDNGDGDDDDDEAGDDARDGADGRDSRRRSRVGAHAIMLVKVPAEDGKTADVAIPRMTNGTRSKEVRLNELGYRMAWLQSRVFAGRTVFLQRALDCYRNKTKSAMDNIMSDVRVLAPHYETRIGKRRWNERMRRRRGVSRSDD